MIRNQSAVLVAVITIVPAHADDVADRAAITQRLQRWTAAFNTKVRNLVQRISKIPLEESEIDLTPWQFRHAQSAIERLEKERFDVRGRATRPL
jgi:hypothetical protein